MGVEEYNPQKISAAIKTCLPLVALSKSELGLVAELELESWIGPKLRKRPESESKRTGTEIEYGTGV
ncbi:hypothetical protein EVAR_60419_1 [Eumeta japonica]|uniref:Uncharacterized protein n=1 Tax=Eumeta variegata TaxID=151549 RepID=A0A4C1ZM47_EUMVA|nr:hypothetical protein EVAR_60419_1 [Eumeta japonica]